MREIEAVLFDLDGTLLDSTELILCSYEHTAVSCGLAPRPRGELLATMGRPLEVVLGEWAGDQGRSAELCAVYREWNLAHHDQMVRPYAGCVQAVGALLAAGLRVGLVTSKRGDAARAGLRVLGLAQAMEVLVAAEDVSSHKPDPTPVRTACEWMALPPQRCVYVGDAVVDMQAGRAAGVRTAAAGWGPQDLEALRAAGPDWWADEPGDLVRRLV